MPKSDARCEICCIPCAYKTNLIRCIRTPPIKNFLCHANLLPKFYSVLIFRSGFLLPMHVELVEGNYSTEKSIFRSSAIFSLIVRPIFWCVFFRLLSQCREYFDLRCRLLEDLSGWTHDCFFIAYARFLWTF